MSRLNRLTWIAFLLSLVSVAWPCPDSCACQHTIITCKSLQNLLTMKGDLSKFTTLQIEGFSSHEANTASLNVSLEATYFRSLTQLVHLDLNKAGLSNLAGKPFINITRLQSLNMSHNFLSTLAANIFDGAHTHLRNLDLSFNQLKNIQDARIFDLPHLKILNLAFNKLNVAAWTNIFSQTRVLETLILDGNHVNVIKKSMFNHLNKLRTLSLQHCSISHIEGDLLSTIPNVAILRFQWNNLEEIPEEIFQKVSTVQEIYLDHNLLSHIGARSFQNQGLKMLGLSYNNISNTSSQAFIKCQIKEIDLSFNDLKWNGVEFFKPLTNSLMKLNLAGNHLGNAVNFIPLYNLQRLNLSRVGLSKVPKCLHHLKWLKRVDLSQNHIHTLSSRDLRLIRELDYIDLYQNPWNCNCKLHSFQAEWRKNGNHWYPCGNLHLHLDKPDNTSINNHSLSLLQMQENCMVCSKPKSLAGQSLLSKSIDLPPCNVPDKFDPSGLFILCGVIVFIMLLLIFFMWWRRNDPVPWSARGIAACEAVRHKRSSWVAEILPRKKSSCAGGENSRQNSKKLRSNDNAVAQSSTPASPTNEAADLVNNFKRRKSSTREVPVPKDLAIPNVVVVNPIQPAESANPVAFCDCEPSNPMLPNELPNENDALCKPSNQNAAVDESADIPDESMPLDSTNRTSETTKF